MRLDKLLPSGVLRYQWETFVGIPHTGRVPFPKSRQGWFAIGQNGHEIPTGDAVHAQAPLGDGTRGVLTLWVPWWAPLGGTAGVELVNIALLDTGDPVPPLYATNPVNCGAGRVSLVTSAGEPAPAVAGALAGAINMMMGVAGIATKFGALNGQVNPNVTAPGLGNGTLVWVSPRPYRECQFYAVSGAWPLAPGGYDSRDAAVRPLLFALCSPCPWLVVGDAYAGRGQAMPIID